MLDGFFPHPEPLPADTCKRSRQAEAQSKQHRNAAGKTSTVGDRGVVERRFHGATSPPEITDWPIAGRFA